MGGGKQIENSNKHLNESVFFLLLIIHRAWTFEMLFIIRSRVEPLTFEWRNGNQKFIQLIRQSQPLSLKRRWGIWRRLTIVSRSSSCKQSFHPSTSRQNINFRQIFLYWRFFHVNIRVMNSKNYLMCTRYCSNFFLHSSPNSLHSVQRLSIECIGEKTFIAVLNLWTFPIHSRHSHIHVQ